MDSGGYQLAVGTAERDIILGAYTLWLQLLLREYGNKINGYMGLDTGDWVESMHNYDYMRSEGLTPIPVWKAFWPSGFLDALCQEYDYIAIGGIAFGGSKENLRHIMERVMMTYPTKKFHMLGVGIRGGVSFKTVRPYSVDVSTWSAPARFGHDIILDKKQILKEVKLPDDVRQRLRDDQPFQEEMLLKAIHLLQSLETELDKRTDAHQIQMRVD